MTVSTLPIAPHRQVGRQERLLPRPSRRVASVGELRPLVGDVSERVAAGLLGAARLQTRTGRWCPDLELASGEPAEVKLLGPSSSVFLHESQAEAFVHRPDYQLVAIFHRARWSPPISDLEAQRALLLGLVGTVVVPGRRVKAALASSAPVTLPDGRRGVRLKRRLVNGWWRSHRRHAHRARCPELGGGLPRPLVEIRTWSPSGDWWPAEYRAAAEVLLDELRCWWHEVILTPAPEPRHAGHMVRTVVSPPLDWYRDLLAQAPMPCRRHRLKPGSQLKRDRIEHALEQIAAGKPIHPTTEARLLPYLQDAMEPTP